MLYQSPVVDVTGSCLTNSCWKYELTQPEVTVMRKCVCCTVLYVVTASLTLRMWLKGMCHLRWLLDSCLALFTVFSLPARFKINSGVSKWKKRVFFLFEQLLQQCIGEIPRRTGFNFLHCYHIAQMLSLEREQFLMTFWDLKMTSTSTLHCVRQSNPPTHHRAHTLTETHS